MGPAGPLKIGSVADVCPLKLFCVCVPPEYRTGTLIDEERKGRQAKVQGSGLIRFTSPITFAARCLIAARLNPFHSHPLSGRLSGVLEKGYCLELSSRSPHERYQRPTSAAFREQKPRFVCAAVPIEIRRHVERHGNRRPKLFPVSEVVGFDRKPIPLWRYFGSWDLSR